MSLRPHTVSRVLAGVAVVALALSIGTAGAARPGGQHVAAPAHLNLIHAGFLTVGTDATYPPMEASDVSHPGTYVGADIDLAKALAKAMGLKGANIVNNPFSTIIPALQRKKFDVIMSSMNDTPERGKVINFVDYMRASEGMVVVS